MQEHARCIPPPSSLFSLSAAEMLLLATALASTKTLRSPDKDTAALVTPPTVTTSEPVSSPYPSGTTRGTGAHPLVVLLVVGGDDAAGGPRVTENIVLADVDKTALKSPLVDVTSIPNIFPGRSTEAAVAFFFPWIDDSPKILTSQT